MQSSSAAEGLERQLTDLRPRYGTCTEVDVVVEVRQVPIEGRGVGEHSEGVLVEADLLRDDLYHDLFACAVGNAPMHGGAPRVSSDNLHAL